MVSDVDLAEKTMSGTILAKAVAARWPNVGIMIVSGMIRPADDDLPNDSRFLSKPFTEQQLSSAVASLIDPLCIRRGRT